MNKPLRDLTLEEHTSLLTSDKLWELYPHATGNHAEDTRPMKLAELYEEIGKVYARAAQTWEEKFAAVDKLYAENFHKAIIAEGFSETQANIIGFRAYEQGHSSSSQEIVGCAMELCEFAKRLLAAK